MYNSYCVHYSRSPYNLCSLMLSRTHSSIKPTLIVQILKIILLQQCKQMNSDSNIYFAVT